MIPYITLGFIFGIVTGFFACYKKVEQELKAKTVRVGKRVYRVVHETGAVNG